MTFGAWLEMNRSPIDSSLRNIDFPDDPQRGIGGSVVAFDERLGSECYGVDGNA